MNKKIILGLGLGLVGMLSTTDNKSENTSRNINSRNKSEFVNQYGKKGFVNLSKSELDYIKQGNFIKIANHYFFI